MENLYKGRGEQIMIIVNPNMLPDKEQQYVGFVPLVCTQTDSGGCSPFSCSCVVTSWRPITPIHHWTGAIVVCSW